MDWPRIIGVGFLLYAAIVIYRGRISSSDKYSRASSTITRSENPIQFWLSVAIALVCAALLIFHIIDF